MKNEKRYTTQTFKKRVDHEGGFHRTAQKPQGRTYCGQCGSVYENGHWIAKKLVVESFASERGRPARPTTCPACKQIENGIVGGYLSIGGGFLKQHRTDIENLLMNEAERSSEDNPLSRIINQRESNEEMMIETTTEHLAQRLGHALKKAFDGEVQYQFSHENKVVRVSWHRDS